MQEAMAFLNHVYAGKSHSLDYERVATATFTQPPMGSCGLTEARAIERFPNVDVYLDGDGGERPREVGHAEEHRATHVEGGQHVEGGGAPLAHPLGHREAIATALVREHGRRERDGHEVEHCFQLGLDHRFHFSLNHRI